VLITNKSGPEIIRDEGEDCVIARIQFDNRPEELGDGNIADARLIAAAPELYEALRELVRYAEAVRMTAGMGKTQLARLEAGKAALAKARGQ
jgi:hypothetical protein